MPEVCGVQVDPLVVARIVPLLPTAKQWVVLSARDAARECCEVPEVCGFQVDPSVVARIVPVSPTAKQWVVSAHETPWRASVVPEVCVFQVDPSVVASIMPSSPTAMQWVVLAQLTPRTNRCRWTMRESLGRPGRTAVGGRHDPRASVAVHRVHHAAAGKADADRRAADGVDAVLGRRQGVCEVHVAPPSVDLKTRPMAPNVPPVTQQVVVPGTQVAPAKLKV